MILIVNGINTLKGGSGAHLLNIWLRSMMKHGRKHSTLNTIPTWSGKTGAALRAGLLALYFLPGTFLRVLRLPLFELAYKVSPFLLWKFLRTVRKEAPDHVLFSHHAVFYLSFFFSRERSHFIVHDLLYRRSKSLGYSSRLSKFVFWAECRLYKRAASLVCLSCHEERILRRFNFRQIQLLSSYSSDGEISPPACYDFRYLALVSDWRRPENEHGVKTFFLQTTSECGVERGSVIHFSIYGFESEAIGGLLNQHLGAGSKFNIVSKGFYHDHSVIREGVFLIPIYQGAGIKIKLLEALRHRRFVVGTPGAFEGIPRRWLEGVGKIVNSKEDLTRLKFQVDPLAFARFEARYTERFRELGVIDFDFHLDVSPAPQENLF